MKLYEINQKIAELYDSIEFDEETGEIITDVAPIGAAVDALKMQKKEILEYLAKIILNTRAEKTALKEEEKRLAGRRAILEKKESRLIGILDRECNGEKTDLGVATLSYRKTKSVSVENQTVAVQWLKDHKRNDCLRIPEPEISKTEVKKLLTSGAKVPGCELVEGKSVTLK